MGTECLGRSFEQQPTDDLSLQKVNSAPSRRRQPTEQEIGYVIIPMAFTRIMQIFLGNGCRIRAYPSTYYNNDRAELSLMGYVNSQKLYFWASVVPGWAFNNYHDVPDESFAAVIHNIEVPEQLRDRGIGSRLVNIWESTLSNEGIHLFVATNIASEKAKLYWAHRGYQVPELEAWKKLPYCMYKIT